jgi:CheY-like chemotaxis protein
LLGRRDLDPDEHRACALAEQAGRSLAVLLEAQFMVSQLSTVAPRMQRVNLAEVVGQALAEALSPGGLTGRTLTVQMGVEPLWLDADPAHLEQVCRHLLDHAVQNTGPQGAIKLTAQRAGTEVVLRLCHDGGAPAPALLPDLGDLSNPEINATGIPWSQQLSLALVRRLVELQGGSVLARSEAGNRGSELVVRLPAAAAESLEPPHAEADRPPRILVIDDCVATALSLSLLLGGWGGQVRVVHDGPSALEDARSHRPDMVLLDIGLAGMDGCEVARKLRQAEGGDRLTLVALSGSAEGKDRAREAGFDYYMCKPVEPSDLEALLRSVTPSRKDEG